MTPEQREDIRNMIYDMFAELYKHKRVNDDEMNAIIKYLAEGDACRKLLAEMGIYTK